MITAQEHETATLTYESARSSLVRARTDLDIARQRLEDATVRAPVAGTVIEKPVAVGQVISSATSSVSGGTTLLKMADLKQIRLRSLVNETDIGNVKPGQSATVVVDEERCIKGCHICVESCPVDCLAIAPATGKSRMKYDDCWYCLACEVDCPTNAITVKIPYLIR